MNLFAVCIWPIEFKTGLASHAVTQGFYFLAPDGEVPNMEEFEFGNGSIKQPLHDFVRVGTLQLIPIERWVAITHI